MGPMCVFLKEKRTSPKLPFGPPGCSRRGLRAPRWPIWPLFEILGGPWDLLFRPLGRPETPSSPHNKNLKRLLGPPRRRQPTYFQGKNAFREKAKNKNEKIDACKILFDARFRRPPKSTFWPPGGSQKPVSKIHVGKKGPQNLKIVSLAEVKPHSARRRSSRSKWPLLGPKGCPKSLTEKSKRILGA